MEILIIGSGCVLGYWLNKNGKQNRVANNKVIVSPNRLPSGPLIYDSNRVKDVDHYVRDLAAQKHSLRVKQMYPMEYDKPIDIFPNDHHSDLPAKLLDLGNDAFSDAVPQQFANNVKTGIATNTNNAAYDPQTSRPFLGPIEQIDEQPMFREFRSTNFKFPGQDAQTEFGAPLSLLTGQAQDLTHANMQPMFGKMIRQPGVSNENSQVLLERFTGMPSSDDQGTYRERREVLNPLPNNPENPQRANINQVTDLYARAQTGVKPTNEYITPVKSFRDAPLSTDQLRILPPNIDQTRGAGKEQVTYAGVLIPGQKGSTRGMLPNMRDNRYDMLTETTGADFVGNRSALMGSVQQVIPNVRNNTATDVPAVNYLAPPTESRKITDIQQMSTMYKNQMDESVTRRMEAFTPTLGLARGKEKGPNTGVFMVKDPEKGFEKEYAGLPTGNTGRRKISVEAPDSTLRDAAAENTAGPLNPNGMKDNRAWQKANIDVQVTNKSMNTNNPFKGQPHKSLGMGNRKAKIEDWVTNKESNQFSQSGLPRSEIPAHMSYDAVFENDTNNEVEGDRFGIARSGITAAAPEGEIDNDYQDLLVTDYINNPTGLKKGLNRKKFTDGITQSTNKLEFGGYFKHGKRGNGEDGKRKGMMRLKQEVSVAGRMNVPMKRDNPNDDHLSIETNLKPEQETIERKIVHRTQPTQVVTDRMPVLIRQRNVEVNNPRLDTATTQIPNDLFPWIKDKSGNS